MSAIWIMVGAYFLQRDGWKAVWFLAFLTTVMEIAAGPLLRAYLEGLAQ